MSSLIYYLYGVKKILIRIGLFALLLWSALCLMDAVLPYYWGNPGYASKMEYIEKKRDSFNVFFMGSSRIYRQVMPSVFDAHTQGTTRSFNLGYGGTFSPESYYLFDHFIRKKAVQPTYILLELQHFVFIANRNLFTTQSSYFLDYEYFSLVKNEYTYEYKHLPNNSKIYKQPIEHRLKNLRLSFMDNLKKDGHSREMLLALLGQGKRDSQALGKAKDGFISLDKSAPHKEGLAKRHERFLVQYDTTQTCFEAEMTRYQIALKDTLRHTTPHLQKINQLIETAARQNYTLLFILPPKRPELIPLFLQIPQKHRINFANPQEFPYFYHNKYWFDEKHFNETGAEIFTRELTKKYMKKNVRKK